MGAPTEARGAARTWIIVTAMLVVATGLILAAASLFLWNRPVEMPTYPAARWSGETGFEVDDVTIAAHGDSTVCPRAAVDGVGSVGLIFVGDWSAQLPGDEAAEAGEEPWISSAFTAQTVGAGVDYAVAGRVLDLENEADAELASGWTDLCGSADAYALVAPDGVTGGELVAR